ncbi:methionine--tRNA ligase [Candidatus Woesearchaeota archaeon]|nr:methionine--tRNA ligase [Candidatus Woesearchaeota archaeon]
MRKKSKNLTSKESEKIIITAALPYANGPIHVGHLLEYIQADIYARFLKLQGKDALYICASDMHGTPVEVNAQKAGKKPEAYALGFWKEHQLDFASYLIHFDHYYHTHTPENRKLAEYFFSEIKKKKLIYTKKMNIIYCNSCQRSLPDRYVRGTCPYCTTAEQYGDVCESCGSVLKGIDLLNPKCALCGKTPLQKESEHYFFKLSAFAKKLQQWMSSSHLQPEVQHWLQGWMANGLDDWCISRDAPYFGFEIPGSKEETGSVKYFYVWMDAPIGYISTTENYCAHKKCHWEEYWKHGKVHHFIGKDISYFHFLFWPAMLMAMNIPVPELTVHGFITINGEKMSKSRGTFFTAKDFLKLYPAEALRFFYAKHLDRKVIDVDLNLEEFKALTNNVLMGNVGNFCYRVLTFAHKNYGKVGKIAAEKERTAVVHQNITIVQDSYAAQDFKSAVKYVLQIADEGNAYFQMSAAWKNPSDPQSVAAVGWCVNLARNIAIIISPILPDFSRKIFDALGAKELSWNDIEFSWKGTVREPAKLVQKIEAVPSSPIFPLRLVVGKIIAVKDHPNADSLYLLTVDLGKSWGKKQVVAGLKKHLTPKQLLNRKAVFCANMKPAKLRGEMSEAMILAADDGVTVAPLEAGKTALGEEVHVDGMENSTQGVTFEEFKKLVLLVRGGKVFVEGKKMTTPVEDVIVHGVKEGARVY